MEKKLYRTTGTDAMILGVCGGLAKYFNTDATFVRIGFALLMFISLGIPLIIYLIMAIAVPKEPGQLP